MKFRDLFRWDEQPPENMPVVATKEDTAEHGKVAKLILEAAQQLARGLTVGTEFIVPVRPDGCKLDYRRIVTTLLVSGKPFGVRFKDCDTEEITFKFESVQPPQAF